MADQRRIPHPVFQWYGRASTPVWALVIASLLPHLTVLGNALILTLVAGVILMNHRLEKGQTPRERFRLSLHVFPLLLLSCLGLWFSFDTNFFWLFMAIGLLMYMPIAALLIPCLLVRTALWLSSRNSSAPSKDMPAKTSLLSASGVSALSVGAVLGILCAAFIHLDDRLIPRPSLTWERPDSRGRENGFQLLREFKETCPLQQDEHLASVTKEFFSGKISDEEEWVENAEEALAPWEACLSESERILDAPCWVWPDEVPDWKEWPYSDLQEEDERIFRNDLARLWVTDSVVHRLRGELEEALTGAKRAIRYGQLSGSGTDNYYHAATSICWLERGFIQVREIALSPGISSELLSLAQEILPAESSLRTWVAQGVKGDYHRATNILNNVTTPMLQGFDTDELLPWSPWKRGVLKDSGRFLLLKKNRTLNILGRVGELSIESLDHYEINETEDKNERDRPFTYTLANGKVTIGPLDFLKSPGGIMEFVFLDSWIHSSHEDTYFLPLAKLRMTRLIVALRQYQVDRGVLPKALDELTPDYLQTIPLDPFTEESFHYEPDASPARLWSVGLNLVPNSEERWDKDDLVVELPPCRACVRNIS